jgi:hypothetical protein
MSRKMERLVPVVRTLQGQVPSATVYVRWSPEMGPLPSFQLLLKDKHYREVFILALGEGDIVGAREWLPELRALFFITETDNGHWHHYFFTEDEQVRRNLETRGYKTP